jgi:hypothetical protein
MPHAGRVSSMVFTAVSHIIDRVRHCALEPPTTRRYDARYRRFSKDALVSRVATFFVVSPFLSGSRLSYQ